jgi:antitoxin component YwqK of YwqJK toxin-antitoxin module
MSFMNPTKYIFVALLFLFSCGQETDKKEISPKEDSNLVVIENGVYTEYYPGKEKVRIQGDQNEKGEREGRWTFFSEKGTELGYTFYQKGKKHGFSYTSYPNGLPYYYGEYWNDKMVGIWKVYDEKGKLIEKDYGYPEDY